RYHFVNENKTWSEAQTYCRDKYTDLATISNMDEMKKLNITLKIESVKLAWIGLKSESVGEWKWSLADQTFYRGGDAYRNWSSGEPNNNGGNEHCVDIAKTGFWFDIRCDLMLPFVCYEVNIPHRYHFVNENKTWSEAQTYCRGKYTDLATISNMDEMKKLNITLKKEPANLAWIGLKSESVGEWKWSQTFYKGGDTYRNWSSGEPNNAGGNDHCAVIAKNGFWYDYRCDLMLPFVCYDGKNSIYLFVQIKKRTWYEAQTFCRENYTDLVSVRNQAGNELIRNLTRNSVNNRSWIGLFNDSWKWSDQSKSSFRYWSSDKPRDDLKCAAVSGSEQHYWNNVSCTEQLPFICH
ncbi:macrophage mannose receptor 1-like isoform X2, partial [Silurus meridionalis]